MNEFSCTGGVRTGWVNLSWPFAWLTSSADRLTIGAMGTWEFAPEQVIAIEPCGVVPLFASGLRIRHNRADYPRDIVFWCMGKQAKVRARIAQSGFVPKADKATESAGGLPVRWSALLIFVLLWNLLFLLDGHLGAGPARMPGPLTFAALLLAFGFSSATLKLVPLQKLVLREGRHIGEIEPVLRLLQLVSGLLSAGFGVGIGAQLFGG